MAKYHVVAREWDHNGSFTMTVIAPWPRTKATDKGVRYAARMADPMRLVRRTRILDVTYDPESGLRFRVHASRL